MLVAEPDLTPPLARRRCAELAQYAAGAETIPDVFSHAARRLQRLVPYDASAWRMADPLTGLPAAPSLLEDISEPIPSCCPRWRPEIIDTLDPVDPARPDGPADPLHRPYAPWCIGPPTFADELRAVLEVDGTPWATVTLWRREGSGPFTTTENELMGRLSQPLGGAVRRVVCAALTTEVIAPADIPPGLLTFDRTGRLIAVNDHASSWLEHLPRQELVPTAFGLPVPVWVLVAAARSTRSLLAGGDGIARTLVQPRHGCWLVGRATAMRRSSGSPAGTVVVIEPAGAALMAPLIAEAFGLTPREQQITRKIARGTATAAIAEELFLSRHTVRDHVKSILHKVGVGSRGELVATLCPEQTALH